MDPSPVWLTPLHHKPIVYGSATANALFTALVVLHIVPGLIAPISAIVAFATKKGGSCTWRRAAGSCAPWRASR